MSLVIGLDWIIKKYVIRVLGLGLRKLSGVLKTVQSNIML